MDGTNTTTSVLTLGQIVYRCTVPAVGLFVILLNGVVIVSSGLILKRNVQPRTTYFFLGNIALCDLVTGIAVVFGSVYPKEKRPLWMCHVHLGVIVACTLGSVFSVGLVAVDRFFYILHGIKYMRWVYASRVRLVILFSWLLAVSGGFLMVFAEEMGPSKRCWLVLLLPKHFLAVIVSMAWIPLAINLILYLIIMEGALRRTIQLNEADTNGTSTVNNMRMYRRGGARSSGSSKWKAIKIVVFTTGAYVITWLPYFVACFLYLFCEDHYTCSYIAQLIASPLAILGFLNSFLNPIIYAWWHKPFRNHAVTLFKNKKRSSTSQKSASATTSSSAFSNSYVSNVDITTHL